MNEIMCRYPGDREQALVAYLYGELEPAERAEFDTHLSTCARCRTELAAFGEVKGQLGRWAAPEFSHQSTVDSHQSTVDSRQSSVDSRQSSVDSRQSAVDSLPAIATAPELQTSDFKLQTLHLPAWARFAAAVLCVGIGAGLANLDVRYDSAGLHVRTGWLRPAPESAAPAVATPTSAELTALEERLRSEISAVRAASVASPQAPSAINAVTTGGSPAPASADVLRRVKALVDESERRQQRELALRVGELVRDVNAQRQSDLARIDRSLGVIQSSTGVEMARQRETLNNILVRTSLQK